MFEITCVTYLHFLPAFAHLLNGTAHKTTCSIVVSPLFLKLQVWLLRFNKFWRYYMFLASMVLLLLWLLSSLGNVVVVVTVVSAAAVL